MHFIDTSNHIHIVYHLLLSCVPPSRIGTGGTVMDGGTNYYSASTYRVEDFILTDTSYAAMKEAWKSAYIQNPDNYKTGVHSEFGYNSSGDWSYADNTLTCVSPGKFNLQWIIGFKLP